MAHKTSRKKEFYVYALLDTRKPGPFRYGRWTFEYEPFYVGKGKNNRADSHLVQYEKNSYKNNKIAKMRKEGYEPEIAYKKTNITERQAFDLEIQLIAKIGRAGVGPLTNLTDGGEGMSGHVWSDKSRKKISKKLTGLKQSQETIAKRVAKLTGQKRSETYKESRRGVPMSKAAVKAMRAAQQKAGIAKAEKFKYQGQTLTIREWSTKLSMSYALLRARVSAGWSISRALQDKDYRHESPSKEATAKRVKKILGSKRTPEQCANIRNSMIGKFNGKPARTVTYKRRTQTLRDWAAETGIPLVTLKRRYRQGLKPHLLLQPTLRMT